MTADPIAPTAPLPPAKTAEELLALPDDGWRYELVRGELRRWALATFMEGVVTSAIGGRLHAFVHDRGLGDVLAAGTGFRLARDPDTVRAPDVAFVRADRVPPEEERRGFAELAPDLVVEVVSPSDRPGQVAEKVAGWLDAGVRLVWVVYPDERVVAVHVADGPVRLLREDDTLDGGDVVPGFALPVADLFTLS